MAVWREEDSYTSARAFAEAGTDEAPAAVVRMVDTEVFVTIAVGFLKKYEVLVEFFGTYREIQEPKIVS